MKKRYYFLTAIFAYFILLIATIPARPFTELLNDNSPVTIQGVSGTLWDGRAYAISINDIQLKQTRWCFKPWGLFTGKIAIDINTQMFDNDISAELGSSFFGRYFINNLSAKITAQQVSTLANIPFAQLDGLISIDIKNAQWKQGEAPLATGEINWTGAAITVADTASLGDVTITLSESEQQLNAEIKNQGGDIKISGTAELSSETDYSVDVNLLPTARAKNNIKQSLALFAQKQPDGGYVLKKSGSLKQLM